MAHLPFGISCRPISPSSSFSSHTSCGIATWKSLLTGSFQTNPVPPRPERRYNSLKRRCQFFVPAFFRGYHKRHEVASFVFCRVAGLVLGNCTGHPRRARDTGLPARGLIEARCTEHVVKSRELRKFPFSLSHWQRPNALFQC